MTTTETAAAPRHDLYVHIHKALRRFMTHTVTRLGAMDLDDPDDLRSALDGADDLLKMLRGHLRHENDFIHTAIEARRAGGARRTGGDHALHLEAIANLEDEVCALRDARAPRREALALGLYRHLAEFVGENLVHMQVEETQNNAALWALYSDAELLALHQRLQASLDPAETATVVRWMAAALNPQELAELFLGLREQAPAPVFDAMLEVARAELGERRWIKLARPLGRLIGAPAMPG